MRDQPTERGRGASRSGGANGTRGATPEPSPTTLPFVPLANVASTSEVVRLGRAASERIQDPLFNIIFRALRQEYLEGIAATEPHEDRLRAHLHTKLGVLQDVVLTLEQARIEGVSTEAEMDAMIKREQEEAMRPEQPEIDAFGIDEYRGFGPVGP
jgi:hypothetical protein